MTAATAAKKKDLLILPEAPALRPRWRSGDGIVVIAMALLGIGIVMVYSSSSLPMRINPNDSTRFLRKQILWTILAGLTFVLARTTPLATIKRFLWPAYAAIALLLAAVLVPGVGRSVNGARRWLVVAGMSVQPSELAKVMVIFVTAWMVERQGSRLTDFKRGFLPALAPMVGLAGLVVLEPDFGSAGLLALSGLTILLVAGAKIRHLALLSIPGFLGLIGLIMLKGDHVRRRLVAFFGGAEDGAGAGYQVRQALIALGSGGVLGQGLGASRQKRMFLPEGHTDFIFALIGEELGFLGTATVVFLYIALVVAGARAALRARDRFSALVAFGITFFIGFQAVMNIAVVTGAFPPKGISLPLISFGGSSLVISAAALGLLVQIARAGSSVPPEGSKHARKAS